MTTETAGNLLENGNFATVQGAEYMVRDGIVVTKDDAFHAAYIGGWRTGKYTTQGSSDIDVLSGNDPRDNGGLHSQMTGAKDMDAKSSNVVDVNGFNTLGWLEQTICTEKGAKYELTYYIGYPEAPNHDQGINPSIRATVMSGQSGDPRAGIPLAEKIDVIPGTRTGQYTPAGLSVRNLPAWRVRKLEFTANSCLTTIRFGNAGRSAQVPTIMADADAWGHTGVELTDASVRMTKPPLRYVVDEVNPKQPVTVDVNQKYSAVTFRVVDEQESQPLKNSTIHLVINPQQTEAHFTSGDNKLQDLKTDANGYATLANGGVQAGGKSGSFVINVLVNGQQAGGIRFKVGQ